VIDFATLFDAWENFGRRWGSETQGGWEGKFRPLAE
jgi:hypothetical protein